MKYFITYFADHDTGEVIDIGTCKVAMVLPKYAVWDTTGRKSQVIDNGNDLDELLEMYGKVTPVFELDQGHAIQIQ